MTMPPAPATCVGCDRPMRSKSAHTAPGVVAHAGHGYCSGCYYRRNKGLPAKTFTTPDHTGLNTNEQRTLDALTTLVTDRRRRGIPTLGVLMDGEKPDKITEIPL